MSVRNWLIALNAIALLGLAAYAIATLRKSPERKAPENLEPFLDDEDLEGRRLERVLGWALLFAAITAVALPLYWLREPDRSSDSEKYFDEGSIERGKTLFAAAGQEGYNAAFSLQCANCHGAEGVGGVAPTTYDADADGPGKPISVSWKAPALNTELLRFSPEEVNQIITYGRPGTPMQPWGLAGGGPKNEQAINDLVAYINSVQLTPKESRAEAEKALTEAQGAAAKQLKDAETALTEATSALADAEANAEEVTGDPDATPKEKSDARKGAVDAQADLVEAQAKLEWARAWDSFRSDVSDGQLLFELYCARCHTKGWSVFDPSEPEGTDILGPPGGGGVVGFNLRDGDTLRRFPDEADHIKFVTEGSENQVGYGQGGIGSGKMPGFGNMLTPEMIEMIVTYEREGLEDSSYDVPFPLPAGAGTTSPSSTSTTAPTTTTSGG